MVLYLNEKLIFEIGLEAAGLIALGDLGCKSKKWIDDRYETVSNYFCS